MTRTNKTSAKPPFRQKEPDRRLLTSERIADDIQSFQSSGGQIEVLGVTRVLTKLDQTVQHQPARSRSGTRSA